MKSIDITVHFHGFHVLFAKKFTDAAAAYATEEIRLALPERNIISDAKSILGVMALDVIAGTVLTVRADGPREEEAAEALAALLRENI